MYLDWLDKRSKKKKEIITNARNGVIRWLEKDKQKGGYILDSIKVNTYDHLIILGFDDLLFDEMDAGTWLVNDVIQDAHDATDWWIWIFGAVCDELCQEE